MGDVEVGKCGQCHRSDVALQRKYYYYDIDCDCCDGTEHFVFVRYCSNCRPVAPTLLMVHAKHVQEL